jgi:hypothetical protein
MREYLLKINLKNIKTKYEKKNHVMLDSASQAYKPYIQGKA